VSKKDRPDLEPGFWSNYQEPDPLARAIMYPLADPHWQERVIAAYVQNYRQRAKKPVDKGSPS